MTRGICHFSVFSPKPSHTNKGSLTLSVHTRREAAIPKCPLSQLAWDEL